LILYTAILFSAAMLSKETYLNIVSIISIIVASLVVVTVGELRIFGTAQGQGNLTSSLTAEQKAAICDPSDTHINITESKICGKPVTPSSNSTSSGNVMTGAESSSSSAAARSTGE
jgi:hypothetical protein